MISSISTFQFGNVNFTAGSQAGTASGNAQASAPKEDTVQLSAAAQKALGAAAGASTQTTQPTLDEVIRKAADGDIAAIAQLALV